MTAAPDRRAIGLLRLGRPRSLRERLALSAALVTALCVTALAVAFNVLLSRQLRAGADDLLHSRAAATLGIVDIGPDGALTLNSRADDRLLQKATWVYQGRVALVRAPGDSEQQQQADALVDVGERLVQSREPEAVRYYALPLRVDGRQVGTVVSSVGLDPYDSVERLALLASAALSGLVLVGAYLLARSLIGRVLTPVAQMTEQAARWSSTDLERRFGPGDRPLELQALAATLDGVLDRLAAVLRHEQQLSAELSHELRTPLAAVLAEVELLDSRPRTPPELAAGHAAIAAAGERMDRVITSLLTAARAGAVPGRCEVLPAVHAAVDSVHPPAGVLLVREGVRDLVAGVDATLLERALAPVLDNALRFCRRHVVVEVLLGPAGPEVVVQDDGPGVAPDVLDRAFEPGISGRDSAGGAGLGLALARRLARAGGGDLDLDPAPAGARFVLRLPGA